MNNQENKEKDIIKAIPSEIAVAQELREKGIVMPGLDLPRQCQVFNIAANKDNIKYFGNNPYILSCKLQQSKGFDIVVLNNLDIVYAVDVKERPNVGKQDAYMELYYNESGELDFGYNQSDLLAFKLLDGTTKSVRTYQILDLLKTGVLDHYLIKQAQKHYKDGKDLCIPFGKLEELIKQYEKDKLTAPISVPDCKYIDIYASIEEIPVGINYRKQILTKMRLFKQYRM